MTAQARKLDAPASAAEIAIGQRKRPARAFEQIASRVDIEAHPSDPRITWRRAAYRAVQGHARAVALVGVLPAVVDRNTLETSAGNRWFRTETGLGDRAVTYGLAHLSGVGLIALSAAGPRRTIALLVPQKPAHGMHPSGYVRPTPSPHTANE